MEDAEVELFVCAWWNGRCGCYWHRVGRVGCVRVVVGGEVMRRRAGMRIAIAVLGWHDGDFYE